MSDRIRLQKYLAQCGVASRRKAEELIASGRITVDGAVEVNMGVKIDPARQKIAFDGNLVSPEEKLVYILLNKPRGYVTTLADPQGRPIVTDLVQGEETRLFPVGRLDLDTEGALILTNDGDFAQKIQHPSYEVTKTYEAVVSGVPSPAQLKMLETGIELEGKITSPATISVNRKSGATTMVTITIHEGRKRQVRKMFQAIGHPVVHLKRIAYGALYLRKLPPGSYRRLTAKDLNKIFKNIPLQKRK